jgi:hypothetical protein
MSAPKWGEPPVPQWPDDLPPPPDTPPLIEWRERPPPRRRRRGPQPPTTDQVEGVPHKTETCGDHRGAPLKCEPEILELSSEGGPWARH